MQNVRKMNVNALEVMVSSLNDNHVRWQEESSSRIKRLKYDIVVAKAKAKETVERNKREYQNLVGLDKEVTAHKTYRAKLDQKVKDTENKAKIDYQKTLTLKVESESIRDMVEEMKDQRKEASADRKS